MQRPRPLPRPADDSRARDGQAGRIDQANQTPGTGALWSDQPTRAGVDSFGLGPEPEPVRGPGDTRPLPPLPDGPGRRLRPSGTPEVRDGRSTQPPAGRLELAEELAGMAASLGEVDPRSAERLEDLARSIGTEDGRQRWADVDLRRAFNTERLARAFAVRREGGYAPASIDVAARVRDILILLPIFLTWFSLSEASKAYQRLIERDPDQVRSPFLLLWERGFGGEASAFAPTFSFVAIVDAAIIGLIIALTFYVQGRREAREDKIALRAEGFQSDLDNVLAEATVALANDRSNRPALLAHAVEQLAERFDHSSQELLTRLRVEHDRLEQIAGRREREFADFGVFASGMRAGAEETHRLLIDLRQVSTNLQTALEDLTSEVGVSADQQRTLLSAVQGLERLTASGIQSDQAVTRQLTSAANTLADAADRSLAGAEAAAQAGRVATEAVRGIAELASDLAASQSRVEAAVAAEAEANSRLADALRAGTGGVTASTRSLQEIAGGLADLREEFARLAAQSADQAGALNALLAEHGTVAMGLSQVARDLSAVGIATAQRQREVNEDVTTLLNRLDALTNLLARATASAPTTESLQQAFTNALRSELGAQADILADVLDARAGGAVGTGATARRDRGLWPRSDRRPGT